MKVSDLSKVQQIDNDIQRLLGDLSALYKAREEIFNDTSSGKKLKPASLKSLSKFDLTQLDLSLGD